MGTVMVSVNTVKEPVPLPWPLGALPPPGEEGWTVTVTAGPPGPLAVVMPVGTMTVKESVP